MDSLGPALKIQGQGRVIRIPSQDEVLASVGSFLRFVWHWNKLRPFSGLSLLFKGFPKVVLRGGWVGCPDSGMQGPEMGSRGPWAAPSPSLCPPQCGVPAFTVPQPDAPLAVLRDRAQEISCPLYLCPPLEALEEGGPPLTLGLEGEHQRSNAALALQLTHCWLQQKGHQGEWAGEWVAGDPWNLPLRAPLSPPLSPPTPQILGN